MGYILKTRVCEIIVLTKSSNRPHVSEKPYSTGFSETFSFDWLQIGYTSHLATIRYSTVDNVFKLLCDLRLLIGIQVAVGVQCSLDFLVSEPVGDQQRLTARLHKQAGAGHGHGFFLTPDFWQPRIISWLRKLLVWGKSRSVG